MNLRNLAIWGVIILGAMAFYVAVSRPGGIAAPPGGKAAAERPSEMSYSDLLKARDDRNIEKIEVRGETVKATLRDGQVVNVITPVPNATLVDSIQATGAAVDVKTSRQSVWVTALLGLLPFVLIIGLWILIMRQMQGGARGA
ncbi:MAG: ATP-dependent metallopeptidase FtsH/Yme1/Tma family protein, partial [Brevundimonas sp.]